MRYDRLRWARQEKAGFAMTSRKKRYSTRNSRLGVESLEDRRMLATIVVDSALDNTAADGAITLREAIIAANTDSVADAIEGAQAGNGADSYRLQIEGLVRKPGSMSLDDLRKFGEKSTTATLTCAGNRRAEYNKEGKVGGVQWEAGAIGNASLAGGSPETGGDRTRSETCLARRTRRDPEERQGDPVRWFHSDSEGNDRQRPGRSHARIIDEWRAAHARPWLSTPQSRARIHWCPEREVARQDRRQRPTVAESLSGDRLQDREEDGTARLGRVSTYLSLSGQRSDLYAKAKREDQLR